MVKWDRSRVPSIGVPRVFSTYTRRVSSRSWTAGRRHRGHGGSTSVVPPSALVLHSTGARRASLNRKGCRARRRGRRKVSPVTLSDNSRRGTSGPAGVLGRGGSCPSRSSSSAIGQDQLTMASSTTPWATRPAPVQMMRRCPGRCLTMPPGQSRIAPRRLPCLDPSRHVGSAWRRRVSSAPTGP